MTADTEQPSTAMNETTTEAMPDNSDPPDRNGAVEMQETSPPTSKSEDDENEKDNDSDDDSIDDTPTPALAAGVPPRPAGRPKMQRQMTVRLSSKTKRSLRQWPRTIACCWGIFLPLNMLVCVSLIGGLLLGKLEMSAESQANDAVMRLKMAELKYDEDLDSVLQQLPSLCLAIFNKNETIKMKRLPNILQTIMTNKTLLELEVSAIANTDPNSTEIYPDNLNVIPGNKTLEEMAQFFATCGQAGGLFRDNWRVLFTPPELETNKDYLTFNYIRCVDRDSPLAFNLVVVPDEEDMHDALPKTQAKLYEDSWIKNREDLEEEYRQSGEYSELEALTKSYEDATGTEKCAVNMPSAAWFWFTVMTTVGYGNQVPISWAGRLLTYTMGFLSILLFGGVLATAGSITTHLTNDALHRLKRRVSRPAKIFVWGCMWLLWMVILAHQAKSYQDSRLQTDLPFNDAYWLAFITTTTVGFGDYYLQPEGLFVSDLLGLWGTYLIGFVFLSSFLTELSQLLGSVIPNLADDLQRKLKYAYDNQVPEEILRQSQQRKSQVVNWADKDTGPGAKMTGSDWSHPVLRKGSNHGLDFSDSDDQPTAQVATPTIYEEDADAPDVAQEKKEAEEQKQPQQEEQKQKQEAEQKRQQDLAAWQERNRKQQEEQKKEQQAQLEEQKKQQQAQPEEQKKQPAAPASSPPQKAVTFVNTGTDLAMVRAELYYRTTPWGVLGHGDPPVSVMTYPGDQWYIVANGVYVKLFTVGESAEQKFTI